MKKNVITSNEQFNQVCLIAFMSSLCVGLFMGFVGGNSIFAFAALTPFISRLKLNTYRLVIMSLIISATSFIVPNLIVVLIGVRGSFEGWWAGVVNGIALLIAVVIIDIVANVSIAKVIKGKGIDSKNLIKSVANSISVIVILASFFLLFYGNNFTKARQIEGVVTSFSSSHNSYTHLEISKNEDSKVYLRARGIGDSQRPLAAIIQVEYDSIPDLKNKVPQAISCLYENTNCAFPHRKLEESSNTWKTDREISFNVYLHKIIRFVINVFIIILTLTLLLALRERTNKPVFRCMVMIGLSVLISVFLSFALKLPIYPNEYQGKYLSEYVTKFDLEVNEILNGK